METPLNSWLLSVHMYTYLCTHKRTHVHTEQDVEKLVLPSNSSTCHRQHKLLVRIYIEWNERMNEYMSIFKRISISSSRKVLMCQVEKKFPVTQRQECLEFCLHKRFSALILSSWEENSSLSPKAHGLVLYHDISDAQVVGIEASLLFRKERNWIP